MQGHKSWEKNFRNKDFLQFFKKRKQETDRSNENPGSTNT